MTVGGKNPEDKAEAGLASRVRGAMSRTMLQQAIKWLPAALIIVGMISLWEMVVRLNDIPHWKLPAPKAIFLELWTHWDLLLRHTWVTLEEVMLGFSIALITGVVLAALINQSRTLERVIYPSVIASQTIPIIVIAPLLLIWLGYGIQHKVIVVALISFFPIVVNTVDGLKSVDPDMMNLLRTLGATRWQLFTKLQIPNSLPFMFSGIKIAITVSVIGAVIGEWVGSSEGLGYLSIRSKSQFLTERVYAVVVLLSFMGIGLFLLAGMVERLLLPWHHSQRRQQTREGQ